MNLVVQKLGDSSVANVDCLRNVADIITKTYSQNNDVVVVVSVQGDTTDGLIAKAKEVSPRPSERETDIFLTAGGQMSASLLAMTVERMRFPVVSLLGWQTGSLTDTSYGFARAKRVTPDRVKKELDKRNIVIVTGFRGINRYNDMTTLGRGDSDTSAVAVTTVMHADLCQIYTGVEGVCTADPRKIKNVKKTDAISYDEMLELTTFSAQVLNSRSVGVTKKCNIELKILSSYNRVPGTIVKEVTGMKKMLTSGIAKDDRAARVAIIGVPDHPGLTFKVSSKLSAKSVNVDIIPQSIGRNGTKNINSTVSEDYLQTTMEALTPYAEQTGAPSVVYDEDVAKVPIIGTSMEAHPGIAAMMFEALFESSINIQMIPTSEIKISVLVERKDADKTVVTIHSKFFPKIVG